MVDHLRGFIIWRNVEGKINKGSTPVNPEASHRDRRRPARTGRAPFPARYFLAATSRGKDSANPMPKMQASTMSGNPYSACEAVFPVAEYPLKFL
jgi:hypothetical protein